MIQKDDSPIIPDKLYFTIGEVALLCDLRPHVLRYWEQEFTQLTPSKRRGNRRYYQRKDVFLIRFIKDLLYNQGYTIEGARLRLSNDTENKNKLKQQEVIRTTVASLTDIVRELEAG